MTKEQQTTKKDVGTFQQRSYLIGLLVKRNIANQYYRSFIGVLWTILNPLLTMLVMSFVFSNLFGRQSDALDYPVFILSGQITFNLMRSATMGSLTCLVSQRDLLQKTNVPFYVFPTATTLSSLVTFGFSLIALVGVVLVRIFSGVAYHFYPTLLLLFVMLPALLLFSLGLSYILSILYVFFRDIKHFYEVFCLLWMYLTPIFYNLQALNLPELPLKIMHLNPMYHFVGYFRSILMGQIPSVTTHLICYGVGIVVFLLGLLVLRLSKNHISTRL